MIILNQNDLIGDFIGTIPAMQEMARRRDVKVVVKDSVADLLALSGLERSYDDSYDGEFNLHAAFALASRDNLHMNQANYKFMGLDIPDYVPRPELHVTVERTPNFDYILAPFSRSLPPEQKWNGWQELVDSMPDKRFAMLGNASFDSPNYIEGENVIPVFNHSMNYVCNLLQKSKGLISVVTGISHLAYALNVPNWLFFDQGKWGQNMDATLLKMDTIPSQLKAML